ncbi:hypothetical protein BAE44_0022389 [Dichanthelium oligosanthes]|uniref:Plant heme peroxidase family profile domain-containing protein n=1 Tax=Dichanthelium oligosanthes TaxID=888268 RepID=A0A1E5UUI6_9POAL|nr:hypothetical protein BAE44_0022389 [Dichanthelium oligosanthes]
MARLFAGKGLTPREMVALAGAHTVGFSHCAEFAHRIYGYCGAAGYDPRLNPEFAHAAALLRGLPDRPDRLHPQRHRHAAAAAQWGAGSGRRRARGAVGRGCRARRPWPSAARRGTLERGRGRGGQWRMEKRTEASKLTISDGKMDGRSVREKR